MDSVELDIQLYVNRFLPSIAVFENTVHNKGRARIAKGLAQSARGGNYVVPVRVDSSVSVISFRTWCHMIGY